MRSIIALVFLALTGCVYVSKDEYDSYWDADGDGWPLDQDCDDTNPDVYPYAPDLRGDGCDADCGAELDTDGDDWPDVADCLPEDPDAYPCSPNEVDGDGIDHDCDGEDSARTDVCPRRDPDFDDAPNLNCGDDA